MNINDIAKDIHINAINHGWWMEKRPFGEIISKSWPATCHIQRRETLHGEKKTWTQANGSNLECLHI